jgi:hypothetical protein
MDLLKNLLFMKSDQDEFEALRRFGKNFRTRSLKLARSRFASSATSSSAATA